MGSELQYNTSRGIKSLDMTHVQDAENRIQEIAYVTPGKAGELLSVFNYAHLDLAGYIAKIELEIRRAERRAGEVRSVIVLDKARDILKSKGLVRDSNPAGSEDLRQAILDADAEYQDALDRVEEMKALNELLRNKSKSIEFAYHAVKKLIDISDIPNSRETRTNGYLPEDVGLGEVIVPGRMGYVKPKI